MPGGLNWCAGLHKQLHGADGFTILHEVTFSHVEGRVWEEG